MGLIECPDCQKQMSDTASFCPDCGRPMQATRRLSIDGDEVTFTIEVMGQAMSVPEGGKTDEPEPVLVATAWHDGDEVWSGAVAHGVTNLELFSEQELERLYRVTRS